MSDLLIVDDDPGVRAVLRRALGSAGLPARFAVDGRQALALADQRWPAVVLLDLTLPGDLDGWATWASLERAAQGRPLAVVVWTGDGLAAAEARQRGAVALLKSAPPALVVAALARGGGIV